jgi:N-acetylmuramoyl-L-alanine amidase
VEIFRQLIPFSPQKRPGRKMEPKWLTIHSTANLKSTAQNERDNLARADNTRQASFHLVVDEKQAIMCIPLNEIAYHAGDGKGPGNMQSIALEICESGDREKTLSNAARLAAQILLQMGWGVDRMVQHHHWSGKDCPRILRQGNGWGQWVEQVKRNMEGEAMAKINKVSVILPGGQQIIVDGIMQEGKNYVAIRQVLEKLGYVVGWDGKNVLIDR